MQALKRGLADHFDVRSISSESHPEVPMLLLAALILVLLWAGGFFVFAVGSVVHVLLVIAVILVILYFVNAPRQSGPPAV